VLKQTTINKRPEVVQSLVWCMVCRNGGALVSINEVNLRRARLVLVCVTVSGFNSRWLTFISLCYQPPQPTQPGHPLVGERSEYQPKSGDSSRMGSSLKAAWFVCGWQVKLCDSLVTHRPYLSALEMGSWQSDI